MTKENNQNKGGNHPKSRIGQLIDKLAKLGILMRGSINSPNFIHRNLLLPMSISKGGIAFYDNHDKNGSPKIISSPSEINSYVTEWLKTCSGKPFYVILLSTNGDDTPCMFIADSKYLQDGNKYYTFSMYEPKIFHEEQFAHEISDGIYDQDGLATDVEISTNFDYDIFFQSLK